MSPPLLAGGGGIGVGDAAGDVIRGSTVGAGSDELGWRFDAELFAIAGEPGGAFIEPKLMLCLVLGVGAPFDS